MILTSLKTSAATFLCSRFYCSGQSMVKLQRGRVEAGRWPESGALILSQLFSFTDLCHGLWGRPCSVTSNSPSDKGEGRANDSPGLPFSPIPHSKFFVLLPLLTQQTCGFSALVAIFVPPGEPMYQTKSLLWLVC